MQKINIFSSAVLIQLEAQVHGATDVLTFLAMAVAGAGARIIVRVMCDIVSIDFELEPVVIDAVCGGQRAQSTIHSSQSQSHSHARHG